MATIDDLISVAERGFIPDEPGDLAKNVEGFPELFRTLIIKFDELSIWAGGNGFAKISNGANEMSRDCGAAAETAQELAMTL